MFDNTHAPHHHSRHHHHRRDGGSGDYGRSFDPREDGRRSHRDPGFGPEFGPGFGSGHGPHGHGPHGGGPRGGGRRGYRAGRGDIRNAILSLLAEEASNGYGLIRSVSQKTGGVWDPSPGSVYPTLQQLVEEGLIVAQGEGQQVKYALTSQGSTWVGEHGDELDAVWAAIPSRSSAEFAFMESLGKLRGVMRQFRDGATDEQRLAATKELDRTRKALYLILADEFVADTDTDIDADVAESGQE